MTNSSGITNGMVLTNGSTAFKVTNSALNALYIYPTNSAAAGATNIYNKLSNALTNRYYFTRVNTTNFTIRSRTLTDGLVFWMTPTIGTVVQTTNANAGANLGSSNFVATAYTLNGETITNWDQAGTAGSGTVGLVSSNNSSIRVTPSVIAAGITNFGLDVNTNVIASVANLSATNAAGTNSSLAAAQAGDALKVSITNDTSVSLLLSNGQFILSAGTNGAGLYAPLPSLASNPSSLLLIQNFPGSNQIIIGDAIVPSWTRFRGASNVFDGPIYGDMNIQSNGVLAAAQAGDLVVSNALVTTINSKLSTNTQGSWVNVITYGADPWGIADNSALFSLLFSTKTNVLVPAGDYYCATQVNVSNSCNIFGYGALLFNATNTSASSAILNASAQNCKIRGFTFSDERLVTNELSKVIQISAIGFPVVEDVDFWNSAGASVTITGDADIFQRSNHLTLNNLFFDHCYGGVDALSAGQGSQYTTMDNFEGNGGIAYGIKVGAANVRISSTVSMTGQQGNPTFQGVGLFASFTNAPSHLAAEGHFAHWGSNVVENVSGSANTAVFLGNIVFSASANYFKNLNGLTFNGDLIESYSGSYASGCSNSVFSATDFRGSMTGFTGLIGADCRSNTVVLVPDSGSWTNFLTKNGSGAGLTGIPASTNALQLGGNPAANFLTNNHAATVTVASNFNASGTVHNLGGAGGVNILATGGGITVSNANNSAPGDIFAGSFRTTSGGIFVGDGANITALNASQLTSGTVANAVFTNLNRTNVTLVNPVVSGDLIFNGGSVGIANADGKMRLTNSLTLGGNTFGPAMRIIGRTNDDTRSFYVGINAINLGVVGIGTTAGALYIISGDGNVTLRSGTTTMADFSAAAIDLKTNTLVRGTLTTPFSVTATNGLTLPQMASSLFPTNLVPVGVAGKTNWGWVNYDGIPMLVATNMGAGGFLTKALYP